MKSVEIQQVIYDWAMTQDFTAPYGVLMGKHTNKKGKQYLSVTFGRARTLDATVEIYNRNFMILRTNLHGNKIFKDFNELQEALNLL